MADFMILVLVLGYCVFLIRRGYKNKKEGKPAGCAGCSGHCGSCSGCPGHSVPITDQKKGRI